MHSFQPPKRPAIRLYRLRPCRIGSARRRGTSHAQNHQCQPRAVTLNSSTPTYNPLTILGGVTVSAPASIAVYGDNSQAWTITNAGTISSPTSYGIELAAGGTVTNSGTAARIAAGVTGVWLKGGPATVVNQGSISGGQDGVILSAGGYVSNSGSAAISGGLNGVYVFGAAGVVTNRGTITGTGTNSDGVHFVAGGRVSNIGTPSISGGQWGVFLTGSTAATIINQGTISGAGAVHFGNANGNVLYLEPGEVTNGLVQGGTGTDTLVLGGGRFGAISGVGSQFTGFELVEVRGVWLATGSNTIAAPTQLKMDFGVLKVGGTLTAPGNLSIASVNGTLAASDGGRVEVGTAGTARAGQIVIDSGHTLVQSGTYSMLAAPVFINRGTVTGVAGLYLASASSVTNSGTAASISGPQDGVVAEFAATITNQGSITGSVNVASNGLFVFNNVSLLEVAADTGASNAISFLGASGDKLVVDTVGQFGSKVGLGTYTGPKLENFATFDLIDLKNLVFGTATIDSYTAATGLLQLHSGTTKATLLFDNATLGGGSFHLGPDTDTGTVLTRS